LIKFLAFGIKFPERARAFSEQHGCFATLKAE